MHAWFAGNVAKLCCVCVCLGCMQLKGVMPGYTTHVLSDGDEVVIFDNDAMLPMFVIHYS